MANDTGSKHKANNDGYTNERQTNEKGGISSGSSMSGTTGLRRSARETSSKKMIASPSSTQKSEQLGKQTPPTLAVRRSPKQVEKQNTPSPLRRSLRTMGYSSSTSSEFKSLGSPSSKQKMPRKDINAKQMIEDEEVNQNEKHDVIDVGTSQLKSKRMNARDFRAMFKMKAKTEFQKQLDRVDELSEECRNNDGGKRDENVNGSQTELKENVVEPYSRLFKWEEKPLEDNCAELVRSGRKDGAMDEAKNSENLDCIEASKNCNQNLHSDVPARIASEDNCNLIADASSLRLCECKADSTPGTCGACSNRIRKRKRIQHLDGSVNILDIESDNISKCRKVNNNADKPSSRAEDEGRLPTGNIEAFFIDQVSERTQGNKVESENVRKLHDEQRSLLLALKPTIAKLCDVLRLPHNVKSMVDNFLEYVMNNHQVHREPASILQAFQISLCWAAASLLKHKIDHKDSLKLARQHLNFDCKKEEADYIYSMLRCLKRVFLYRTGNFCNNLSPEASNRVDSCTGVVLEVVELAKLDISKSKREIQKKCQKQLRKLLVMQQQEKEKLHATHKEEKAALERQYEIKSALVRHSISIGATSTGTLKILDNEYAKKIEALEYRHEKNLKDLEGVQMAMRQKFEDKEAIWLEEVESWVQVELSNMPLSQELQTEVEYFQISEKVQSQDGLKNVGDHRADREGCDKMDKARTRTRIGLSVAPEIMSDVPCRNSVELQTPLVEHASTNEMDTVASGGGSVSQNKSHYRAENICDGQASVTSVHSYSREQNPDRSIGMTNKGKGNQNFSSGGCRVDKVMSFLPSSSGDICGGATLVVPRSEMDVEVQKGGCSTNGLNEIPSSRLEILGGTISGVPACGLLSRQVEAADSGDGLKNIASLNCQSSEENIQTGTGRYMPNSQNAAQSHEFDDGNISNNAVTLTPLSEERMADGPTVNVLHREESLPVPGTGNFTDCPVNDVPVNLSLSMEQISDGGAMEILDRVAPSRLCEPTSPNGGPDTIGLSNSPLSEEQIPVEGSLSTPEVQAAVEMPQTSPDIAGFHHGTESRTNDGGAMEILDRVVPSRLCEPASPNDGPDTIVLSKSPLSEQQISLEGSLSTPDVQAAVEMLQTSPNVAGFHNGTECQRDAILFNKSTTSDLQGRSRTMDENDLSQETPVLTSPSTLVLPSVMSSQAAISVNEALQDPCTSSFSSSREVDDDATVEEMRNSNQQVELVSNPVNAVLENQSNHDSLSSETLEEGQLQPSAESLLTHHIAGVLQDSDSFQQVDLVSSSVDLPASQSNYESQVEEPPEQGQHLPSAQWPSSNQDAQGEMLDSPQHDEPVCCPVNLAPVGQSNHESLVTMPVEQVQRLPTVQSPSSNQDPSTTPLAMGTEHQPTIENSQSHHVSEASISVSNQPAVQPVSNSERDLHTPVGIIRSQSSDTRNMSTPSVISNCPTETAGWPLSRRPLSLQSDPLNNELERIRRETEQTQKNHEDMKLRLKSDCEEEIAEIHKKYDTKLKQLEDEFQLRKKNLDSSFDIVLMNKVLAEAFRSKCTDLKVGGASGVQQDASYVQRTVQLPRQQSATRPNLMPGISSPGIPAANLQSTSTMVSSEATMVPPVQPVFNTPGIVSSAPPTRPPHFNSISLPTQNIQVGSEIRSPAPHLQPYRPPTPASASIALLHGLSSQQASNNIPTTSAPSHGLSNQQTADSIPSTPVLLPHLVPSSAPLRGMSSQQASNNIPTTSAALHGMSNQQAPNSIPTTPVLLPHLVPRSTVPTYQSDPHNRIQLPENARGLPMPNLSAMGLCADTNSQYSMHITNVMQRILDAAALNPSQFNVSTSMQTNSGNQSTAMNPSQFNVKTSMQANSGNQSTSSDVVCLSDDE